MKRPAKRAPKGTTKSTTRPAAKRAAKRTPKLTVASAGKITAQRVAKPAIVLDPFVAKRRAVVETARRLEALGLNRGTSGNVSVRAGRGFLVTPSGVRCGDMSPSDVVELAFDGTAFDRGEPSTEWPLHAAVYAARPEARAVVHAHSEAAMALACLRRDVPAFHYMVAVAGSTSIRCAPYHTFGTPAIASAAVAALEGRRACLLANHGQIAFGATLKKAVVLAVEVESLCATYLRALSAGEPALLSDEQMAEVLAKFETYGQRRESPEPEPSEAPPR